MYAWPSFVYISTPSPSKHWHASLVRTSPHHAPQAALLPLPEFSLLKASSPPSDPPAHVAALARLQLMPEPGADPLENPAFLSFFCRIASRCSSVVRQSCQLWCHHKGNYGNRPPRQVLLSAWVWIVFSKSWNVTFMCSSFFRLPNLQAGFFYTLWFLFPTCSQYLGFHVVIPFIRSK